MTLKDKIKPENELEKAVQQIYAKGIALERKIAEGKEPKEKAYELLAWITQTIIDAGTVEANRESPRAPTSDECREALRELLAALTPLRGYYDANSKGLNAFRGTDGVIGVDESDRIAAALTKARSLMTDGENSKPAIEFDFECNGMERPEEAGYVIAAQEERIAELEADNARLRKSLEDFRDNGMRADLNPTQPVVCSWEEVSMFFLSYIKRIDQSVRERAKAALEANGDTNES